MPKLLVGVCLAVVALSAAVTSWTYASSDHFEIYTTGGERRAREALVSFERVHAFFTEYMGLSPAPGRPTRLILFSSEGEFKPYRSNAVARAYYQASADYDWIVMSSLDADAQRVVVHEYVHLIVRHSNVAYPVWLNEGLAEFFSTIETEGSKMAVGHVPIDRLQYLNTEARLIPLARLLAVAQDDPEYNTTAHAGTFYSESWALVHMLMTDARYRPNAHTFMDAVGRGEEASAVLSSAFGKSVAAVQSDLEGYIRKQVYVYFTTPYTEAKINDKSPVRVVDSFEAGLVTANLLAANSSKETEARAAFDTLSQQKPDDVGLIESRAFFELRADHDDVARALFEQAVNLNSTNAATYREYATRFGLPLETAEPLLQKALALAPTDLRTRMSLADTQVRLKHGADALATLAPVTRVGPDDAFRLLELLANAHVLERQLPEALGAARQAVDHAGTPQEKQYAANLLQTIGDYAARVAQSEAMRKGAAVPAAPAPSAPAPSSAGAAGDAGRAGPGAMAMPPLTAVGRIKNMICSAPPILEVATSDGTLRLAIDDPLKIRVLGTGQVQTDLNCGPQDVPIRVGYEPLVDRARNTVGNVRVLDFSMK